MGVAVRLDYGGAVRLDCVGGAVRLVCGGGQSGWTVDRCPHRLAFTGLSPELAMLVECGHWFCSRSTGVAEETQISAPFKSNISQERTGRTSRCPSGIGHLKLLIGQGPPMATWWEVKPVHNSNP